MARDPDFSFGEGGVETLKNFMAALIGDAVDTEKPDEDRMVAEMEDFVSSLPSLYRMGTVWMMRGLEVAPFAMGYRHQFSNLPREDQVKVLIAFEKSSNYIQRAMILSLKSLVLMSYMSAPEIEAAIGYDHRCLLEAKKG